MLKNILSIFTKTQKTINIRILKGTQQTIVQCKVGSNLMDVTNSLVNENVNIYGLCDKQLACTTCRIDIDKLAERLPAPSEQQMDVLLTTRDFKQETSRMACQITLTQQLDGMIVRIQAQKSV